MRPLTGALRAGGGLPPAEGGLLAAAGLLLLAALLSLAAKGVRPLAVAGDSMAPAYHRGDLLLTVPAPAGQVEVGDVVVTRRAASLPRVAHRVTAVRAEGGAVSLTTRGDANRAADPHPVRVEGTVRRVQAHLPLLGWPALARASPAGLAVLLGAGLLVGGVALLRRAVTSRGRPRAAVVTGTIAALTLLAAPAALAVLTGTATVGQNSTVTEDLEPAQNLQAGACLLNLVSTDIDVAWDPTPSAGQDYRVLRSTDPGGPYDLIATVDLGIETYVDTDVLAGTTYHYAVRTDYEGWVSQNSNEDSAKVLDTC